MPIKQELEGQRRRLGEVIAIEGLQGARLRAQSHEINAYIQKISYGIMN